MPINVASGNQTSINQLISELSKIIGQELKNEYKDERLGDIKHSYADISLVMGKLDFAPCTTHHEGLKIAYNSI